ncbi:hypothetical protein F9L33_01275 [Amylibacter sp. SFDW26]|uniref:hypothetical protein n=1 Tax=Amylibacter sp. SFDW26 TaxID=2652722 RepID=UPI0012629995|nr:hypothetical protein [Amylibacter sp. SFDW26]KAB7615426.1 hypothetical protein F9L33_01275 [Amylibacter sp. SFDW26]
MTEPQKLNSISGVRQAAIKAHQKGDLETARNLYGIYLQNRPKDAVIWSNLGALFRKEAKYDLAVATHLRALELDSTSISVMNNAANAFYDAGRIKDAIKLRKTIVEVQPNNPENYSGLGKCYRGVHQLNKAQNILKKGIKKFPDYAENYIQLAFVQLAKGDYQAGFKTFNWRWKGDELTAPEFSFPKWDGEDLNGKTILVIPEQGFGDTVLMARFLSTLKSQGCTIKMVIKTPLRRLFAEIEKDIDVIETQDELAGCDYWVPMMDLPLHLKATLDDLPAPAPMSIPEDSIKRARNILAPFSERFKIGVMWSGSVTYRANHKRSFGHEQFLELSDIPDIQMFSLYKGPLLDDFKNDGTSTVIVDAAGNDRDFADSAALMQELDLVISMDSAIVHVAGSMGIEVWNLLHSEPYWLYRPFPKHTPWYPSMRLIIQENTGDWDAVFKGLKKDIIKRVKQWKKHE